MEPRIAGLPYAGEQEHLQAMAQVLGLTLRIQGRWLASRGA